MKRILLVRHGETDQAGCFCGNIDPDLNAAGKHQARMLATELNCAGLEAVYSSDLRRAWETAHTIAAGTVAAHFVSRDLREIAFGAWEGLRWSQVEELYPFDAALWTEQYPNRAAPGGEDFSSFTERVLRQMHRIQEDSSGLVCVVSHGGVIRLALTRLFGVPEEQAWVYTRNYGRVIDPSAIEAYSPGGFGD